jgi:hypothetical protein
MKAPPDQKTLERVLQNGRAVVHMRQQIIDKRFGLVLGAGAGVDLGFPSWNDLIARIAADSEVDGVALLAAAGNHGSRSQLLYQYYKAKMQKKAAPSDDGFNRLQQRIRAGWQKIVHDALYREVPKTLPEIEAKDRYLWALLDVIKETRLTVNYNFDNSLQRMLASKRTPKEARTTRGYATTWSSNVQLLPRDAVIYHPNGYLPHDFMKERASEDLVFLEDTFADQLIDSMSGQYASLSNHLAQTTCLFVGLSLEDGTLKHLLRQNARMFPGHFHYYVAFVGDGATRDKGYETAVADSNFEVYNLVTLFLDREEIAALGHLLSLPDDQFRHLAEECGIPYVYRFLVTGSVAVGKSTTVQQFKSLRVLDEWMEERPHGMERDPSKVDPSKIAEIDQWIFRQLYLKNLAMLEASCGIYIIDRAPLDAFAFTPESDWQKKAEQIRKAISPRKSKKELCPAHIILLSGDPDVMAARALGLHKDFSPGVLEKQQDLLKLVYSKAEGISVIDARDLNISQVTKRVARVIHREPYNEAPMQEWMLEVEKYGYAVAEPAGD